MGISLDMPGKGGIPLEIVNRLLTLGAATWVDPTSYTYDIETMKVVLEQMVVEAGVDVLLYTRLTAVVVENRRIQAIRAEGMRSYCFLADWFVDGTGHGALSSMSGCSYDCGILGNDVRQPASLEALVTTVSTNWVSDIHNRARKKELYNLFWEAGIKCSYPNPLLFKPAPISDTYVLAINHEYGVDGFDGLAVSQATIHARKEIFEAVKALRRLSGWEHLNLVTTSEQLGLRDNRRIHGQYCLTVHDAMQGTSFEDGVVPMHLCFDIHEVDRNQADSRKKIRAAMPSKPFQIPMRSLIPVDIDNLFLVGRCISGDFFAHSIYRVTCTAAATGEAVSLAIDSLPSSGKNHDTDGKAISYRMVERGYCLLP
jgi:hypothetical protein